ALDFLEIQYIEIKNANDLAKSSHVILPGVGAFNYCMSRLAEMDLIESLNLEIIREKKLFLGICVGHQILMSFGTEFEKKDGLGWIAGQTEKLIPQDNLPVPHIGWTEVDHQDESGLFSGIETGSTFYFVHSYYVKTDNEKPLATSKYGIEFTAAVQKNNIFGVQFHPEKSQENGLRLLKNFSELRFGDI
ncbi:imidazole glycerol phosphate synthase subunit HisH, partial [Gammaproteobacteria bacterium]|nr:imidazole glycerol phosphate synthase subunit HisH [Gammaproteobacteria bacterium]